MSTHHSHRWHRMEEATDNPWKTYYDECICGATRKCTGKPGEYTYTQKNGERTKLAGKCSVADETERVLARLARLDDKARGSIMRGVEREVTILECIHGFREAGLTDTQIRQELINAGHLKESST